MRSKLFSVLSVLILLSMVLSACAAPQPAEVVKTVVVEKEGQQVVVTATPEPVAQVEFKSKDPTAWNAVQAGEPETLDPALDYESAGGEILYYVYDRLLDYKKDSTTEFVPSLATEVPTVENGGISADGLTYTFKIRPDVKFHNGEAMTLDDVVYTFQRGVLQGGLSSPQWLFTEAMFGAGVDDIAVVVADKAKLEEAPYDDPEALGKVDPAILKETCEMVQAAIVSDAAANTVSFKLKQPWGAFLPAFLGGWGSIQNKKWAVENGAWDGSCDTWQKFYGITSEQSIKTGVGSKAMGTGVYMFDHWTPKEELVLKANENYWRTEPAWEGGPVGPAKIKTYTIKYVDEFSTRLSMLQAGDADDIQYGPDNWPILDELVGETCEYGGACTPGEDPTKPLRLVKGHVTGNRTDVFFNFKVNTEGNTFIGSGKLDGNGIPADFFSDVHIRKAFAYCFDYETFLADVLQGEGVRSRTIMLPGMIGYDEAQPIYEFDAAKCEEEFKASTLKSEDGKGVWDTGFRVTMVYNTGNTTRQTIAQIFQQGLSAINDKFVVEVTGLPWPAFLRAQRAKQLPVFTVGWIMDLYDTHNWVVPYTTGTYGNRQNLPAELQDKFREIYSRGIVEVDPAKRAEIYKEFNKLYYDEIPGILLFQVKGHHYEPRYISGWFYNPIFSQLSNSSVYALEKK